MQKHSVCTLSLALTLAIHPGYAAAASHCKGLQEQVCGSTAACKWLQAVPGGMNKSPRKAHCRLDVAAAAKLAASMAAPAGKTEANK